MSKKESGKKNRWIVNIILIVGIIAIAAICMSPNAGVTLIIVLITCVTLFLLDKNINKKDNK